MNIFIPATPRLNLQPISYIKINPAHFSFRVCRSFSLSMFEILSEGKGERILDLLSDAVECILQQSAIKGLQEVTLKKNTISLLICLAAHINLLASISSHRCPFQISQMLRAWFHVVC